jgi:hypothetical protein
MRRYSTCCQSIQNWIPYQHFKYLRTESRDFRESHCIDFKYFSRYCADSAVQTLVSISLAWSHFSPVQNATDIGIWALFFCLCAFSYVMAGPFAFSLFLSDVRWDICRLSRRFFRSASRSHLLRHLCDDIMRNVVEKRWSTDPTRQSNPNAHHNFRLLWIFVEKSAYDLLGDKVSDLRFFVRQLQWGDHSMHPHRHRRRKFGFDWRRCIYENAVLTPSRFRFERLQAHVTQLFAPSSFGRVCVHNGYCCYPSWRSRRRSAKLGVESLRGTGFDWRVNASHKTQGSFHVSHAVRPSPSRRFDQTKSWSDHKGQKYPFIYRIQELFLIILAPSITILISSQYFDQSSGPSTSMFILQLLHVRRIHIPTKLSSLFEWYSLAV